MLKRHCKQCRKGVHMFGRSIVICSRRRVRDYDIESHTATIETSTEYAESNALLDVHFCRKFAFSV